MYMSGHWRRPGDGSCAKRGGRGLLKADRRGQQDAEGGAFPGAEHNDLQESPVYRDALRRALGAL